MRLQACWWIMDAEDGGPVAGPYDTQEEAEEQLRIFFGPHDYVAQHYLGR